MLLLTWHGTILRVEQSQNRLIHTPLVPDRPVALDFAYTDTLPAPLTLHPGPHPGAHHILRDGKFLIANPGEPYPTFESGEPAQTHTVLALTEAHVAALRSLLATPHRHAESGEEHTQATLHPGFRLNFGPHTIDLAEACPTQTGEGLLLPGIAGLFLPLSTGNAAPDIHLRPAPPPPATDPAGFFTADAAALDITGAPERHFLPLAARFATRDWFYAAATEPPPTGPHTPKNRILHQRDAFLLAGATIFTPAGVLHGSPSHTLPMLTREADHFFIGAARLDAAPSLAGPHAWLPPPNPSLLLNTILPLVLLAPHLPPDTTLLLPPGADQAALAALLDLFGFAAAPRAAAPDLCRVQDLFWPATPATPAADTLATARNRARHTLGPAAETRRRLFLPAGLTNSARLESVVATFGFEPVDVAPLPLAGRAALFADALAIIAVTGPTLENLVFCPEGTHVLELTADTAWNPRASRLSNQLGLTHAVLPCTQEAAGLRADPQALRGLLRVLQARE